MADIKEFSEDDFNAIVSLPYRAAIHVSYAEDEDGGQDDALEMDAMEACLKAYAKSSDNLLCAQIAGAILDARDQWRVWEQGTFNIEPLCHNGVSALARYAREDDVRHYKKMVLSIARDVAQAYGEFGDSSGAGERKGVFGLVLDRLSGNRLESHSPMNVSAAEDEAISRIRAAMDDAV